MNLKRKMLIAVTLIAVIVLVQACRKFDFFSKEPKTPEFTVGEAKEWYYGVFKKSDAFKQIDSLSIFTPALSVAREVNSPGSNEIKKYPYWSKGEKYSLGNLDVVEMPVVRTFTQLVLPGSNNLTEQQKMQIATASVEKALFIKTKDGKIAVRLVIFIPDIQYLNKHQFDISHNTMHKPDSDFSGYIVIKEWNEKVVNFRKVEDGKYIKNMRIAKYSDPLNKHNDEIYTGENPTVAGECGWVYTSIYQQWLTEFSIIGDDPNATAYGSGSVYRGEIAEYVDCGQPDPNPFDGCMGLVGSSDICNCELYGIGCDGGGGDEPPPNDSACINLPSADNVLDASAVANEIVEITSTSPLPDQNGQLARSKKVKWKFYKGSYMAFGNFELISWEEGKQTKIANIWKWQDFNHLSHGVINSSAVFTASITSIVATSSLLDNNTKAKMNLDFIVQVEVNCFGQTYSAGSRNSESWTVVPAE